jgi:hypothetical protein
MHWDGYTVFSVLSGICLIACTVLPGIKVKDRAYSLIGGVIFTGYGIAAAHATSGVWTFPVIIFIIPFAVVAYFLLKAFGGGKGGKQRTPRQ